MSTTEPAVLVDGLAKWYASRSAVRDLSFRIEQGEIFSLLGPNGAGKTTTVEILEGYRRPDEGRVAVLGLDPAKDGSRLKPRIGAMLQETGLYPTITPLEALQLFSRFYRNHRDPAEMLEMVGLQGASKTRYRRLSGGQKQRLALALAIIGRPELIFLDEPTAGLDPQARRTTWEIISGLRSDGATIFITTHYLEEAERLADRVAIIDEGRLIALDHPSRLVRRDASTVRLRTVSEVGIDQLKSLPSAGQVREQQGTYIFETADVPSLLVEITSWMRDAGIPLTELRVGEGSLEDVFLRMTGKEYPT